MNREFWLERWSNDEIGFHQAEVNPWLIRCWPELAVPPGSAVFVPLCGKSLDVRWLAEQGHQVVGVDLAEAAVRGYFAEAGVACQMQRVAHHQLFCGGPVSIYCGDFMDMIGPYLRGVTVAYDRAALIALPPDMRLSYADHLLRIVPDDCRILLLTLEYPQQQVAGPPHSVPESEVQELFGARCEVETLHREPTRLLPPKFAEAGVDEAVEAVYRITKQR